MRKVISMLLFVAAATFATSCDDLNDLTDDLTDNLEDVLGDLLGNETDGMTKYTGVVTVANGYTIDDAEFYIEEEDGKITIVMVDIKFTSSEDAPVMDITLSDISIDDNGDYSVASIAPNIVMAFNGVDAALEDVSRYTVTDVSGNYTEDAITLDFTCMECGVNFVGSAE